MKIYVMAGIIAIAVAGCGASDNGSTITSQPVQIDTDKHHPALICYCRL